MKNLVIKDSRLTEDIRYGSDAHVFRVGPHTSIYWAWKRIKNYADFHGKLKNLIVECHGFERDINQGIESNVAGVSIDPGECISFGGIGLELCKENLTLSTVSSASQLKGSVENILVYSCSAADQYLTNVSSGMFRNYSGETLMRLFSEHSGAVVYASDSTQYSDPVAGTSHFVPGHWSGDVFEFKPGQSHRRVASYPIQ